MITRLHTNRSPIQRTSSPPVFDAKALTPFRIQSATFLLDGSDLFGRFDHSSLAVIIDFDLVTLSRLLHYTSSGQIISITTFPSFGVKSQPRSTLSGSRLVLLKAITPFCTSTGSSPELIIYVLLFRSVTDLAASMATSHTNISSIVEVRFEGGLPNHRSIVPQTRVLHTTTSGEGRAGPWQRVVWRRCGCGESG